MAKKSFLLVMLPLRSQVEEGSSATNDNVTLVSEDGVEILLEMETARLSKTLSLFLDPELGFEESLTRRIQLKGVNGKLLERVCSFLQHRKKWDGNEHHPSWEIGAEESLDLLLVADYLEI
jgi:transcription elongation factor B subunit 1